MSNHSNFKTNAETPPMRTQKWGGLASIVLAAALIAAPLIYLTGNLRDAFGAITYFFADFLYGPLWAASFITAFLAIRERIGEYAPRRMSLAQLTAILAAGTMVLIACIRSANRQYHLLHPELHLEESTTVLAVWTTLVAGLTGAAWHFLGWAQILIGWAGWASNRLPRGLCIVYLIGGFVSFSVYMFPLQEGTATLFAVIWSLWQGIIFLRNNPERPAS